MAAFGNISRNFRADLAVAQDTVTNREGVGKIERLQYLVMGILFFQRAFTRGLSVIGLASKIGIAQSGTKTWNEIIDRPIEL